MITKMQEEIDDMVDTIDRINDTVLEDYLELTDEDDDIEDPPKSPRSPRTIIKSTYCAGSKRKFAIIIEKYIEYLPWEKFKQFLENPYAFADELVNKKFIKIHELLKLSELILYLIKVKHFESNFCEDIHNDWLEFKDIIKSAYEQSLREKKSARIENLRKEYPNIESLECKRDELDKDDILRIIIDLYILCPPQRADYGICSIQTPETVTNKMRNYIIFDKNNETAEIHLKDYKTSYKYEEIIIKNNDKLYEDMNYMLEKEPGRVFIFEKTPGKPFCDVKDYDRYINNHLRRLHPELTINGCRFYYATTNCTSFSSLRDDSDRLAHTKRTHIGSYVSFTQSDLYKKLI
ncbi:hypothetical protein WA158_008439 [Blastocystis sp. Blastoise]